MIIDLREQAVAYTAHRGAELADGAPVNRSVEYIGEHGCHSRSESLRLVFDPATGNHGIADRDERQRFAIR